MHISALHYGKVFFETYLDSQASKDLLIVDVGAQDVNGSLRQFAPLGSRYIGVDFVAGAGVDVVIKDPYTLPFETGSVDAVVCSSVYEHSEFFWLLFLESLRILKPTGLLYLNAPSNGALHRYPIDAWRFYPDAGKSLTNWGRHNGMRAVLLESFIGVKSGDPKLDGMWNDFVAVVARDEDHLPKNTARIIHGESIVHSAYLLGTNLPVAAVEFMPDQLLIEAQMNELLKTQSEVKNLHRIIETEQAEKDSLRNILQTVQEDKEHLHHEVYSMRQSKSWRATTPLRAIGSFLKALRNPGVAQDSGRLIQPAMSSSEREDDLIRSSASFEALSGLVQQDKRPELKHDASTLIAFYLPQYHRVPENSEWWGPGFTEWTNVVKGKPNYDDHYQPHLPRELGFYDLSNVEVMREQAQMAKLFGVGAFCFYYYWFSGRRILEKPIDNFLHSDIDMPYCLCWANENWTRTWDGDTRSVLLEQKYQEADPMAFIESVMPHFMDRRYLKVDGKPMLVVYRAKEIPEVARVFDLWREALKAAGFPGLHIVVVDFYDIAHPDEVGADALVEFPPHKFNGPQTVPDSVPLCTNNEFRGGIVDYAKVMAQSANRTTPNFTLYRGVVPSWDNTARRQNTPTILLGSSPELFEEWLRYVRAYSRETLNGRTDNFIFINAWNEWGEGCHLEPDQKHGLKYLEAVKASSWYDSRSANPDAARKALLSAAAASVERRSQTWGKQQTETRTIEQILGSTRPAGGTVQKIAFALRDYPVIHGFLKRAYKSYKALRNL